MSDSEHADPPAELTAAIQENPEAVAAFVERLDAVNELLDVVELGEAALDDEMVAELTGTGVTLVETADGLATVETVTLAETVGDNGDSLSDALESLVALQESGALADLVELAGLASLLSSAADDEMVRSLSGTGASLAEVADTAAEEDTRDGLETVLTAVGEAETEDSSPVGPLGLVRATRDDEVQAGLGYLLALATAIGRATDANSTTD